MDEFALRKAPVSRSLPVDMLDEVLPATFMPLNSKRIVSTLFSITGEEGQFRLPCMETFRRTVSQSSLARRGAAHEVPSRKLSRG
jgi:hypothetical protein